MSEERTITVFEAYDENKAGKEIQIKCGPGKYVSTLNEEWKDFRDCVGLGNTQGHILITVRDKPPAKRIVLVQHALGEKIDGNSITSVMFGWSEKDQVFYIHGTDDNPKQGKAPVNTYIKVDA